MNVLKTFRLDEFLACKLNKLAKWTCPTEEYHLEKALRHYFAEYEDARLAKDRFSNPKSKIVSGQVMRKRLDL